jgi:hypothetical protein
MGGGWVGDGWGRGGGWGWGGGVGGGWGRILRPISCSLQSTFRPAAVRVGRKNKTGELGDRGADRTECVSVGKKETEVEDEETGEMRSAEVK